MLMLISPYTSGTDRKRRRGVIEKRRRDRINCSLADLKRLVPDSNHKPGSAKLEKAEILQITVEFLQRLHKEGYVLGSEARSVELRRIGFKDCLLEVTRLLSTYDGVSIPSHELSRHLLNHLHQCEKQRDIEAKTYLANIASVANAIYAKTNSSILNSSTSGLQQYPSQSQPYSYSRNHQYGTSHANSSSSLKPKYPKSISSTNEQPEVLDKQPTTLSSINSSVDHSQTNVGHQNDTSSAYQNSGSIYIPYQSIDCKMPGQQDSHKYPYMMDDRYSEQLSNYSFQTNAFYPNYMHSEYWNKSLSYTTSSYLSSYTSTASTIVSNGNGIITCEANPLNANYNVFANSSNLMYFNVNNINNNTGNSQLSAGLGPNESQSTSSPPFRSTPEDSDIGFSPHLKINLSSNVGNEETEDDCNYYNRESIGGFITSTATTTTIISSSNLTTTLVKPESTKVIYQQSHYHNNHEYIYHGKNEVCMNLSGDYQCSPVKPHSYNNQIYSRHFSHNYSNQYNDLPYTNYPNNSWNHINKTTDSVQYHDHLLQSHLTNSILNTITESTSLLTIPTSQSFSTTITTINTPVSSMNNKMINELRE
ncbi:hypothetical protein MN116_002824 [Schistosoma mekongi]|uniref:Hairy/enhancer-of-split related with YRPW motif protein n=1 Tax=Schistosoma mekongi TaxID=38744 RepID=A0AAE2D6R7_SCHME|nr:hypothetical protein MN116_002824 [Schistosoma mekongi]